MLMKLTPDDFWQSFEFRMKFQNLPNPFVEDGAYPVINFTNILKTSFSAKIMQTQTVKTTLMYEIDACSMLVKLTPGVAAVNFINILRARF